MNSPHITGLDVGSPKQRGSTKQVGHQVTIVAGGEDIWNTRDEFHFAHAVVIGDFSLSARLDSLTMADLYTKAGLMVRASLLDACDHAYLLSFGDNQPRNNNNGGIEFAFRAKPGGSSTALYPPQPLREPPDYPASFPNLWLRLTREAGTITSEYSQDGERWRTYMVHRQIFPVAAYVGLAVTSHNLNQTVTAAFSDLDLITRD